MGYAAYDDRTSGIVPEKELCMRLFVRIFAMQRSFLRYGVCAKLEAGGVVTFLEEQLVVLLSLVHMIPMA